MAKPRSGLWSTTRLGTWPVAFIIYINDLAMTFCVVVVLGLKLIMYADDVLLYRTIFGIADFDALQADLDTINGWSV